MPHPLHEQVRRAFNYRCGYCGVTEAAAGGQLTVDHYQPLAAGGGDDLGNLVYACHRCNQYKGNYWPTPERSTAGLLVLHPRLHDLSRHLHENELSGELEPLTPTGSFHIRFWKTSVCSVISVCCGILSGLSDLRPAASFSLSRMRRPNPMPTPEKDTSGEVTRLLLKWRSGTAFCQSRYFPV
jgi:hypothetical protein